MNNILIKAFVSVFCICMYCMPLTIMFMTPNIIPPMTPFMIVFAVAVLLAIVIIWKVK